VPNVLRRKTLQYSAIERDELTKRHDSLTFWKAIIPITGVSESALSAICLKNLIKIGGKAQEKHMDIQHAMLRYRTKKKPIPNIPQQCKAISHTVFGLALARFSTLTLGDPMGAYSVVRRAWRYIASPYGAGPSYLTDSRLAANLTSFGFFGEQNLGLPPPSVNIYSARLLRISMPSTRCCPHPMGPDLSSSLPHGMSGRTSCVVQVWIFTDLRSLITSAQESPKPSSVKNALARPKERPIIAQARAFSCELHTSAQM
jgi:hypothetical protein